MKVLNWWLEALLVGGLLWTEHFALAAVTAWLAFWLYTIRKDVDRVRALVRVNAAWADTRASAISEAAGVSDELTMKHTLVLERDPELWETLKRDAKLVGIDIQHASQLVPRP